MALRTFCNNPSLGGFGAESTSAARDWGSRKTGTDAGSPGREKKVVVDGDAFAQIVKELVDNAVDACRGGSPSASAAPHAIINDEIMDCRSSNSRGTAVKKRVLVQIEPWQNGDSKNWEDQDGSDADNGEDTLRITVIDNGCGMDNIQQCVDPFNSSKKGDSNDSSENVPNGGNSTNQSSSTPPPRNHGKGGKRADKSSKTSRSCNNNSSDIHSTQDFPEEPGASAVRIAQNLGNSKSLLPPTDDEERSKTAGRYGIGLTLCLLHAQRLVPNTSTVIRSATPEQSHWTKVTCVVDTDADSVRCVNEEKLSKQFPSESGTTITLLVPVSRLFTRRINSAYVSRLVSSAQVSASSPTGRRDCEICLASDCRVRACRLHFSSRVHLCKSPYVRCAYNICSHL